MGRDRAEEAEKKRLHKDGGQGERIFWNSAEEPLTSANPAVPGAS